MKGKLTARKLNNAGLFVFNEEAKELYLISKENTDKWEDSNQDFASLQNLVKTGKANHFDKNALKSITDALSQVALLG
jgi:hypothetical protein